jgi:hypothetical protein
MDWPLFLARTHEWGVERCVFLSLYLAHLLVGAKIPPVLLDQLKPADYDSQIETWAIEQIFPYPAQQKYVPINVAKTLKQQSFKDRITVFSSFVFPSRSYMSTRYPVDPNSVKLFFYYPRRWFYLVSRYGHSILKLIIGNKDAQKINQRDMNVLDLSEWLSKPDQ